jgi:hypothetical protein
MAPRLPTVVGAVVLVAALVVLGVAGYTTYQVAKDPSARLSGLKLGVNVTTSGPVASFSWSSDGYSVSFTDTSKDNSSTITQWIWEFGDGTTSTAQNPPPHTYTTACGACVENVSLGVKDTEGRTSATSTNVQVQATGAASGTAAAPSPVSIPSLSGAITDLGGLELILVMFLIGGSMANAARHLLQREPAAVDVPVRPQPAGP